MAPTSLATVGMIFSGLLLLDSIGSESSNLAIASAIVFLMVGMAGISHAIEKVEKLLKKQKLEESKEAHPVD